MRHEYAVKVEDGRLFVSATTLANWKRSHQEYKAFQRRHLLQERDRQLVEPSVRAFLSRMEAPRKWKKRTVSIRCLIGDAHSISERLGQTSSQRPSLRFEDLPIRAYVQEVRPGARDAFTGHKLQDIWRYFRHTWTIPYNSTPGRNIQFLIRDAAQPFHPIVGILGLGNSMIQITARDNYLGWTVEAIIQKFAPIIGLPLAKGHEEPTTDEVAKFLSAMRKSLDQARADIRHTGVLSRRAVASHKIVEILDARLAKLSEAEESRPTDRSRRSPKNESETTLFRKKRAKALLRVLKAQVVFNEIAKDPPVDQLRVLTSTQWGRAALAVALQEQKKRLVGSGIMDIVVCGAIPPYSTILGGKLVTMLATSPTVVNAYRRRYHGAQSEIASAMAGQPVSRGSDLVFLGTTSLYETHSSQYERVTLPPHLGGLKYRCLGKTLGFSSVQFSKATRDLLDVVSQRSRGRKIVNNIFGEGVNPKLRQIAAGLTDLGLDGDLLKYSSRRLVYGVVLAENARAYLLGEEAHAKYYWKSQSPTDVERQIVKFWTERWASKRIQRPGVDQELRKHSILDIENLLRPWLRQHTLDVYAERHETEKPQHGALVAITPRTS